jgi:tRNA A-37 threonylcarbamoyl transferase component Bud32
MKKTSKKRGGGIEEEGQGDKKKRVLRHRDNSILSEYSLADNTSGSGRGGTVYKITKDSKDYYLKILSLSSAQRESTEREMFFSKKMMDLGIGPAIIEEWSEGDEYFMVTEAFKETFSDYLKRGKDEGKDQAERDALFTEEIQTQMVNILNLLQKNNIFHGDATASNWMFDESNKLRLIDFGDTRYIVDPTTLRRNHDATQDVDWLIKWSFSQSGRLSKAKVDEFLEKCRPKASSPKTGSPKTGSPKTGSRKDKGGQRNKYKRTKKNQTMKHKN